MSAYNPNKKSQKIKLPQLIGLITLGVFVVGAAAAYALMTTNTYFGSQASSDRDKCPADSFTARITEKDGTSRKVCKCKNGRIIAFGSGAKCTGDTQQIPGNNSAPGAAGAGTGPAQVIDGSEGMPRGIYGGSGEGINKAGTGGGTKQIQGSPMPAKAINGAGSTMPSSGTGAGSGGSTTPRMIIDPVENR